MKIYNQSNRDVNVYIYPSLRAFEDGDAMEDPITRVVVDHTIKSGHSANVSGHDLQAVYDKYISPNPLNNFSVAFFDGGWNEYKYSWRNNIDDYITQFLNTVTSGSSGIVVEAVYDALIDTDEVPGLLGFQHEVDKDGWVVFWGEDYLATKGASGTPDLRALDPRTVVHQSGRSCSGSPELIRFKDHLYAFCNESNDGFTAYRASSVEALGTPPPLLEGITTREGMSVLSDKQATPIASGSYLHLFSRNTHASRGMVGQIAHARTADGTTWNTISDGIEGTSTDEQPAVAVHDGRIHLAYKESGGEHVCLTSSRDGETWSTPHRFSGFETDDAPSLCRYNGRLYLAFKGSSGHMYVCHTKSDGSWSDDKKVPGDKTSQPPRLIAKGNLLYLAFKGETSSHVYIRHYDTKNWGEARRLESNVSADRRPTLSDTGTEGSLYVSYGRDNVPYTATVKGLIV